MNKFMAKKDYFNQMNENIKKTKNLTDEIIEKLYALELVDNAYINIDNLAISIKNRTIYIKNLLEENNIFEDDLLFQIILDSMQTLYTKGFKYLKDVMEMLVMIENKEEKIKEYDNMKFIERIKLSANIQKTYLSIHELSQKIVITLDEYLKTDNLVYNLKFNELLEFLILTNIKNKNDGIKILEDLSSSLKAIGCYSSKKKLLEKLS